MYDFQYNHYVKYYDISDVKSLFTDTNSLCYHVKTDDIYKDLFQDQTMFDNSDYDKVSEFYLDFNEKVIGKMKDETAGVFIKKFMGLR